MTLPSPPPEAPAPARRTHLLYLHGFRSSPRSAKARRMAEWTAAHRPDLVFACPQLPPSPREAMALVDALIRDWPRDTMAVMGFAEVLRKIPHHWALLRRLDRRLASGEVALVVAVDYPGFNVRVAEAAHRHGVPVLYYITPQVWAWGAGRLPKLARLLTKAAVILPFEEELLRAHGIDAEIVFKVNEGRPHVGDEILNHHIQLVINTPLGRESFFDDRTVRRIAMMHGVPCITTLTGAAATVNAIKAIHSEGLTVRALQEYHAEIATGKA